MKKKTGGLILGALALTVGFAAVSTTLYINGTATIKANNDNFAQNVIFTKANATNGTASIINSGKAITFTTNEFDSLDDTAKLDFTIANNSNYAAKLGNPAVVCTSSDTAYATYLTVTPGNELNGVTIARNATDDGSLNVAMKQSYVGDTAKSITYTCTIVATGLEATGNMMDNGDPEGQ